MLLTTAQGRCIRFLLEDEVRLFKGRDSDGVRGIKLDDGDQVISMTVLTHVDADASERAAYLKQATMLRRAQGEDIADAEPRRKPRRTRRSSRGRICRPSASPSSAARSSSC